MASRSVSESGGALESITAFEPVDAPDRSLECSLANGSHRGNTTFLRAPVPSEI